MGEELACKATHTARVGFDLDLAANEQVTLLIDLDETFLDDDAQVEVTVLDTAEF